MNILKIYDLDLDKSFIKVKLVRLNEEFRGNGENVSVIVNYFENFFIFDLVFVDDFIVFFKFVLFDILVYLQNCGKNIRKLIDVVFEFVSFKGLRLFFFVYDF